MGGWCGGGLALTREWEAAEHHQQAGAHDLHLGDGAGATHQRELHVVHGAPHATQEIGAHECARQQAECEREAYQRDTPHWRLGGAAHGLVLRPVQGLVQADDATHDHGERPDEVQQGQLLLPLFRIRVTQQSTHLYPLLGLAWQRCCAPGSCWRPAPQAPTSGHQSTATWTSRG